MTDSNKSGFSVTLDYEADATIDQIINLLDTYIVQVTPDDGEPFDAQVDGELLRPVNDDGELLPLEPELFSLSTINAIHVY